MRRWFWLPALIAIGTAALAAACGGGSSEQTAAPGGVTAASVDVSITAQDYSFQPAQISGVAGKPFRVTITNQGNATHSFVIDELNINQTISPGQQATVTVSPSGAGQLTFYCRFHRSSGMQGTLTVTGAAGAAAPSVAPAATATASSGGGYFGY